MQRQANNIIHLPFLEPVGEPFVDFEHIAEKWIALPLTAKKIAPHFTVWISKEAWALVLPGVKNESEVFGKTKEILGYIVWFGSQIADSLRIGWGLPILAGYLDGEQLFLNCLRVEDGFYLDLE